MSLQVTMMDSICTIQRPSIGRDTQEGTTQTFDQVIQANMPCSQQEASASVRMLYAQRNTQVSTTFYFYMNPGTEVNDRLISTDRLSQVAYYLVQGEAEPVGRGRLWQVQCERIRQPN